MRIVNLEQPRRSGAEVGHPPVGWPPRVQNSNCGGVFALAEILNRADAPRSAVLDELAARNPEVAAG